MSISRLIHLINKEIINNMFNIIINKFKIMNNSNDNNISNQADNKIINKLMKLNININKNNLDNNNNLDINW